jgi:hypothetical protein
MGDEVKTFVRRKVLKPRVPKKKQVLDGRVVFTNGQVAIKLKATYHRLQSLI